MKPEDKIEEKIQKELSFIAGAELHDHMLNNVLNSYEKSIRTPSAGSSPNLRSIIMNSLFTKLATATVILIAAIAGVYMIASSNQNPSETNLIAKSTPIDITGPLTKTLEDGSVVTLADGAKISVRPFIDKRGFQLLAGAVEVTVTKGKNEFIVTTPYGDVKALGTQFNVDIVDGTTTNTKEKIQMLAIEVREGSVQVSNAKGSSVLQASQKIVVESEQEPYDFRQEQNLPERLRKRIDSMLTAIEAGDSAAWMANYNTDYMFKLIKGQVEYDPNLFGGSKDDAERLQKMGPDINNPQDLLDRFIAMGGIKKAEGRIFVRSVTLSDNGDHAVARCIEYVSDHHIIGHNPQWHFFDNDWWQIDD